MWCNLTVSVCQMPAFDLFFLSHGSAHVQEQGNHVTLRLLAKSINLYQNGFYSVVQKGLGQDVALHIHRKPLFLFVCLFVGVCLFVCLWGFVCLFVFGGLFVEYCLSGAVLLTLLFVLVVIRPCRTMQLCSGLAQCWRRDAN